MTTRMDHSGRFRCQVVEGELLLFDTRTCDTHYLNATATQIWEGARAGWSSNVIARHLTDTYDISLDDALDHVRACMADFAARGVLTALPEGVAS